jgi:hypothetical protein
LFEGEKHSDVPDVELVRKGDKQIDIKTIEKELNTEIVGTKIE